MLKNKPKSVGQFIIDLTPLLDVVFILLIIVLSALGTARNKAAEQQGNGNGSVAVDDQPDTNMYEYVDMVSIFAAYDPLNRKEREVYVVINGDSKDNLSLSPGYEETVWDKCEETIEKNITGQKPVIFSICSDYDKKMLYRDEQSLRNLYDNLDFPNKVFKDDVDSADKTLKEEIKPDDIAEKGDTEIINE